ncbi:MAG: hypothetical protein WCQ32_01530 [bacterium]
MDTKPSTKKTYIPIIVSILCGIVLFSIMVVRLLNSLQNPQVKNTNEFESFYKTLTNKTQSFFQ